MKTSSHKKFLISVIILLFVALTVAINIEINKIWQLTFKIKKVIANLFK